MDELSLPFDLVVVGAGVDGVGIARDAAVRGSLRERELPGCGSTTWPCRGAPPREEEHRREGDPMTRYVLALDLGLTNARAVLVDLEGRIVDDARNEVKSRCTTR